MTSVQQHSKVNRREGRRKKRRLWEKQNKLILKARKRDKLSNQSVLEKEFGRGKLVNTRSKPLKF